jgi:hypothetical protein
MTDAGETSAAPHWPTESHETDPPVTVRTFAREDLRMPVIAFLQAEGVATYTPDGNTMSIDPGMYVALGFYKIQVPTSQVEMTKALLAEWDDAEPLPANVDTGEWQAEGGVQPKPTESIGESDEESWKWPLIVVACLVLLYLLIKNLGGS